MKKNLSFPVLILTVLFATLSATSGYGDYRDDLLIGSFLGSLPLGNREISKIYAEYLAPKTEEERDAFMEPLFPTLNSAMPIISQRAVTQSRRSNFERIRFLNDMQPNTYNNFNFGRNVTQRGQRCCPKAAPILWLQNYGDFMHQQNRGVQGYQSDSYGISLGTDKWIDNKTVVGLGFGGAFADAKTSDRTQWGTADSFVFSAYGGYLSNEALKIIGTIGYAYNDYDITRTPFGQTISSNHQGDTFFLSIDVSKKIHTAWTDFTPFITFDIVCLNEHGYNEKLSDGTGISWIDKNSTKSLIQTVGLRFERSRKTRFGWVLNPSCWFGYIHDYGDGSISTSTSYFGAPPISLPGVSMTADRVAGGLNLNAAVTKQFSFFGGYNGEFGWKFNVQTINAGLTFEF